MSDGQIVVSGLTKKYKTVTAVDPTRPVSTDFTAFDLPDDNYTMFCHYNSDVPPLSRVLILLTRPTLSYDWSVSPIFVVPARSL